MKIRGTAHHIGEKYLQLARDAQSSGDPVMAESYLQHAEHYFRLIAAAQQAQQQAAYGYQRPPGDMQDQDDDNDDDFESLPDRFASPSERINQQQPAPQQPFQPDRQPYANGGDRQAYEARQQYDRQNQPQPQPHYDRQPQPDRQPPAQGYDRNQERGFDNRGGRGERNGQDRNQGYQERGGQQQGPQDRQPRDYDNRGFRNNRGSRDFRDGPQPREQRQPQQFDDQPNNGLPAFITGPTRTVSETVASEPSAEPETPVREAAPEVGEETNLHLRPRRRRRPKGEFSGSEGEARQETAEESAGD